MAVKSLKLTCCEQRICDSVGGVGGGRVLDREPMQPVSLKRGPSNPAGACFTRGLADNWVAMLQIRRVAASCEVKQLVAGGYPLQKCRPVQSI